MIVVLKLLCNGDEYMQNKKRTIPTRTIIYVSMVALFLVLNLYVMPALMNTQFEEVGYDKFLNMLEDGKITSAEAENNYIYFTDTDSDEHSYRTARFQDPNLVERLHQAGVSFDQVVAKQIPPILSFMLSWIVPFAFIFIIYQFVGRRLMKSMGQSMGSGPMQFGKSSAKLYEHSDARVRFTDVAGEDEAKDALTEIVDYLHHPTKYVEIGANMPKGALLVGPPGTGKTLLAKAVAGEANVPFFSISGSEFVEMFVGVGASKVRDLFKQANEKAPCIIFIDEIDTIGKKRDSKGFSGNDEREQTLNQLLAEMDGFDSSKGIVILAATNRPDSLDPALLRPGRLDRRIPVELPDLAGRESILRVHAKKVKLSDNVDFNKVARLSPGASGAELANIINEAAIRAVKNNRLVVSQDDFEESIEVVIAGHQKKNKILSEKEKLVVSYHEVGHALVAALQTDSAPVTKITIIPRTSGALGYTLQVDEADKNLLSKEELQNKIATFTGGRAAEKIIFNSITTGASNDITQATKLARGMITRYGMDDEFGMVAFETVDNPYLGGDTSLACSQTTAARIDQMVVDVVRTQYEKAEQLLRDNIDKLHELSKFLYEKETITGEEFMAILHESTDDLSDSPADETPVLV